MQQRIIAYENGFSIGCKFAKKYGESHGGGLSLLVEKERMVSSFCQNIREYVKAD